VVRARPRILLVNGNSSQAVTDRMATLATAAAPQLDFIPYTPQGGPAYVSTPADFALAAQKIIETIASASRDFEPDGCIIACFGEPGLLEVRKRFNFPIVGMAEASMLTAMQLGGNFAIVTLGEHWPAMLYDLVRVYGVEDRCIGIELVEGTPIELMSDPKRAAELVTAVARKCGAPIVIIGGAALTGLATAIGPLPKILLVDCLQASIAQVVALTMYRRMSMIPSQ
jgi:Asp/Glu/hydantoin racemase